MSKPFEVFATEFGGFFSMMLLPPALICANVLDVSRSASSRVHVRLPADALGDALACPKGLRCGLEAGAGLKTVLARALKCPCHEIMHSATRPVNRRFHTAADLEAN